MMKTSPMNKFLSFLGILFLLPFYVNGQLKSDIPEYYKAHTQVDINVQTTSQQFLDVKGVSPVGALLRSFVLPGWGHFYVSKSHQTRGLIHLGSDLALLGSYFGISIQTNRLEQNLKTFASQHAGTEIGKRNRDFLLSVAEFNSIEAHNDYQERSRNWDKLYEINSANYWSWDTENNRLSFQRMDTKIQDNRQQIPAVISLMVVNRIISGIGAFTLARNQSSAVNSLSFQLPSTFGNEFGVVAKYSVQF